MLLAILDSQNVPHKLCYAYFPFCVKKARIKLTLHILFPTMSISNFPVEILQHTLEYLSSDLHLVSCALVNRSWCAIAMPILWRNPFRPPTFGEEEAYTGLREKLLIDTYFQCFDEETKKKI